VEVPLAILDTTTTLPKKPCSKCPESFPATTDHFYLVQGKLQSHCKACAKKAVAEWREENRARHNANAKRWRDQNPEKIALTNQAMHKKYGKKYAPKKKAWALAHPEICRASEKKWQEKDPGHTKEIRKKANTNYRRHHPDRTSAKERRWRQGHPEKIRQYAKTRRATKKHVAINDLTDAQWELIKSHYGHRCYYCKPDCKACKKKTHHLTQDHIVPLNPGNHTLSNIVPACFSCNSKKKRNKPPIPVQPLLL